MKLNLKFWTQVRFSPLIVFLCYLAVILLFALIHFFAATLSNSNKSSDFSFIEALYFSVVTITTLGYGDILPNSTLGFILVILEAISGVILIGIFLSALWHSYLHRLQRSQEIAFSNVSREKERAKLTQYWTYFQYIVFDFKIALSELTTPLRERQGNYKPNENFKFSDLRDLYQGSLLVKNGFFKSTIERFYEKQDELTAEFKYLMANFDINQYPKLHELIVLFLTVSRVNDVRDALLANKNMKMGDQTLSQQLEKLIKEHDVCPDAKQYQSNVITPVILLYQTVRAQISTIEKIELELRQIVSVE